MAKEDMTEEEAQYWSDYFMKNPPKTDPTKPGIFARRKASTEETIGDLVREEIAVSV
ncbi:MAG: hypothetical protein FWF55_01550 [Treponema sp.]|nr:hypothetical protein [Treponema sp.]